MKIGLEKAKDILQLHYDIEGELTSLPGELDLNFKVSSGTKNYVLKISRDDSNLDEILFQEALLSFLKNKKHSSPEFVMNLNGALHTKINVGHHTLIVRLLTWLDGRLWHHVNPKTNHLRYQLGEVNGNLTKALKEFNLPYAQRDLAWDIAQSLWVKDHLDLFDDNQKKTILYFINLFETQYKSYKLLRKSIVHNDVNNYNILVSQDLISPKISGIIDFGDAIYTQTINDLAITCAYAMMHLDDPLDAVLPLVKGYHQAYEILPEELNHLYTAIAMRLVITVTKAAINKQLEPDNTYHIISEKPAWDLLKKWILVQKDFAHFAFRNACGLTAHPNTEAFKTWCSNKHFSLKQLFPLIQKSDIIPLDLSVGSQWAGHISEINNLDLFEYKINQLQKQVPDKIIAGGYQEPRYIYSTTAYDKVGNQGRESRTIHLGIDFWLPEQTAVHSLLDGVVVCSHFDEGEKEYGGLIILKHQVAFGEFYSLYGHLSKSSTQTHSIGSSLKAGECIGYLGNKLENGHWVPHLHFQIMLDLLEYKNDFPGVAYHSQKSIWEDLCPNPNHLFKLSHLEKTQPTSIQDINSQRGQLLGKSLSLQYQNPLHIVRGDGVFLIDSWGNKYIDTVNNVAHVGHEHPEVVEAGKKQMALLNTNTRYLHQNINELASTLQSTLPKELCVFHFVNSGSEANELAIRMAKTYTKSDQFIVSKHGYHGNTNACIEISSYKFDGKGGQGKPAHTHVVNMPDVFRGKYQNKNAVEQYTHEIDDCLTDIANQNKKPAALIMEPILSCGGQVTLPPDYLKLAYQKVRQAGGVCISDEVQTGCGRMGKTFWGFQLHQVTPDIVTIGKPLGNGHPVAAVVCTQPIAEAFANGMEYFNTFGGNPVSCAIANTVLNVVKKEKLQEQAFEVGEFLKSELKRLGQSNKIIGDVRGEGLFLGIELTDKHKNPLPQEASYLVNRMKHYKILMSIDGPDNNVIKIKPPLVFNLNHAKELIYYLRLVLNEDFLTKQKYD